MDKYCSKDCIAVCDFCKHYRDNGDPDGDNYSNFEGVGVCLINNNSTEAGWYCNDNFECFTIKDEVKNE